MSFFDYSVKKPFDIIEVGGDHWIVEVKADKDLQTDPVTGRAEAAREAVNNFNADERFSAIWQYLLIGETDIT